MCDIGYRPLCDLIQWRLDFGQVSMLYARLAMVLDVRVWNSQQWSACGSPRGVLNQILDQTYDSSFRVLLGIFQYVGLFV